MSLLCPWEAARYFGLYSSNVPPLLYYSHIPALVVALFWGVYALWYARKDLRIYSLFIVFVAFSLWSSFDLVLWATNRPDVTIFFWSLQILLEVLIFLFSFLLVYTYHAQRTPPKVLLSLILAGVVPFIILIATSYNLIGVNLSDCTAIENVVAKYYSYILEAIFLLGIIFVTIASYRAVKSADRKKEIALLSIGVIIFLFLFIYGNLIGSFFDGWAVGQYGLFGMPIFVTFLVYTTVRFKTFNVKVIGSQALVLGLLALLGSELFFVSSVINRILVSITLVGTATIGIFLIRGVQREIAQREQLEVLSNKLKVANTQLEDLNRKKSEFVSIASHQLRTPLTAIKGYSSMLLEGSFGKLDDKAKEAVGRVFESSERLVAIVEDFLNLSRIELGRMHYEFSSTDLKKMVREVCEELTQNAAAKGITLSVAIPEGEPWMIWCDAGKVRQVISNIVDNAIKYTPKGGVNVSLSLFKERDGVRYRFASTDTGIGLAKADIVRLFEKYVRTEEAKKTVAGGSGLGLFVANQIMKAHNSEIVVSSPGPKKGSTFSVTFAPDMGNHATISEESKASILASDAEGKPTETVDSSSLSKGEVGRGVDLTLALSSPTPPQSSPRAGEEVP